MATIDWPSDAAFKPARVQAGLDVPKSAWRGFYTGQRESVSAGSDRFTAILTLAPCTSRADAQKRAAFLAHVASTGDLVRFGPLHQPVRRLGTLGGTPVLSASAAAGARSISLSGARSYPNLLNRGTTLDQSPWVNNGVTVAANFHTDPLGTVTAEKLTSNSAGNDFIYQPITLVIGTRYVLSAYLANNTSAQTELHVRQTTTSAQANFTWSGSTMTGSSLVTGSAASFTTTSSGYVRAYVAFDAAETSAWVRIYPDGSNTGKSIACWGVQLEQASLPTAYAGAATLLPGDFVSIGGNLLQTGYAGATLDDAGAGSVTLAHPLQKAVSSSAAVEWSAPTGCWQLEDEGIGLDYGAAVVQGGIAIPFRQVVV